MTEKTLADMASAAPPIDRASDHTEATWHYADGIPGQGERPDYLESKYKSVAEQARAYKEAQKLLGAQGGAPESYDFKELQEHIDQDNPHIQEFITYAKENKFSQDAFSKSLKTFVKYEQSKLPNVDAEIAKLGVNGMEKVNTVTNWIKNNLTPEAAKALEKLPVKAEVINMLDELRQRQVSMQTKIPAGEKTAQSFTPLTVAEVEAEMLQNYSRYQNDPGYRAQITAKFEQAVG
jgi:hypothetical protein